MVCTKATKNISLEVAWHYFFVALFWKAFAYLQERSLTLRHFGHQDNLCKLTILSLFQSINAVPQKNKSQMYNLVIVISTNSESKQIFSTNLNFTTTSLPTFISSAWPLLESTFSVKSFQIGCSLEWCMPKYKLYIIG